MIAFSPDVQRIVDSLYPPARQAMAAQLSSLEIGIFFASSVLQLVLLFGFYFTGWSACAYAWYERLLKNRLLTTVVFLMKVWGGFALLLLPLDWYDGFVVLHKYGLSLETPATWFHDWIVSWLVTLVVILLIAVPFGYLVRRVGSRWPLIAVGVAAPLIVFGNAIFPAFVAPLFNTYTPLPSSPLTKSILDLAAQQGINASAVYEYDLSLQTTEGNAYVSGLGPTARIAVGDNLLKDLKPDEVLYVVAHEMGHYVLHHIWWGSLYGWLGSIVAIYFLAFAGTAIARRGAPRLAAGIDDPAAIPMLA
ncbi:MAG TPA: M48 family metalloprotease, partial [Candidatus Eremiobacteraceae bacterium]|nr:M48 family metalloprotease [Candidatus Eremiobacteraceae bacterium]